MRIGQLSKQTGCKPETIRFYEQQRLLQPPRRTRSGYRDYDQEHLHELVFIRQCRTLGLPLEETRDLLQLRRNPGLGCEEANRLLDRRIVQLREQIYELRRLTHLLKGLRRKCGGPVQSKVCGIIKSLGQNKSNRLGINLSKV